MSESTPWSPYQRPVATKIAITSANPIRLNFPPGRYTVTEPLTFVTVNGGVTNVTITSKMEEVTGLGEMYTHVNLQFPSSLIGLAAYVWIMGV